MEAFPKGVASKIRPCDGLAGWSRGEAAEFLSSRVLTNPDPAFLRQLGRHRGVVLGEAECRRLGEVLLGQRPAR